MESLKNMSPMQVSTGLLLLSQLVASVMVSLKHKELLDDGSSTDVGANAELVQKLMMFMAVSWLLFALTVMCLLWNLKYKCEMSKNCLALLALLSVGVFMGYGWVLRDDLPELSNVYYGAGVLSLAPLGVMAMEMQKRASSKVAPRPRSPASFAMCGSGY